jgi:hypothetical protein
MTIGRRVQQLERDQEQRLDAAIAAFGAYWWRRLADPATTARRAAALREAGYTGSTIQAFRAWIGTAQTPAERAESRAYLGAIDALMGHPADGATIRAGLAALAPHVGCAADAAPVAIIAALERAIGVSDSPPATLPESYDKTPRGGREGELLISK